MTSNDVIIDRGRGPEIRGTRITVYSIIDYLLEGWPPDRIAAWLDLSSREVEAAIAYIREHDIEVLKEYIAILERAARGNPPELQAKLDASHERFLQLVARVQALEEMDPEVRRRRIREMIQEHRQGIRQGGTDAGDNGRQ
jgi:uncharacterized protein (DUF433 family)